MAVDYEVVSTVVESTTVQIVAASALGWLLGISVHSVFDNCFGFLLKWLIYGGVATGLFLYLFTDFFAEHRMETENSGTYMHWTVLKSPWKFAYSQTNFQIRLYTSLPWNILSRFYGYYSRIPIPRPLRRILYGRYARAYGANMEEAEKPYEEYPTFGEFFNRKLKPGIRPISHASVVSGFN